jgi:hypothetical protein
MMGMTPRQWFALVLRYFGVSNVISAIGYVLQAYDVHKGLYNSNLVTTLGSINHAVVYAALGLALVFFADRLAALVVPARRPPVASTQAGDEE